MREEDMFKRVSTVLITRFKTKRDLESDQDGQSNKVNNGHVKAFITENGGRHVEGCVTPEVGSKIDVKFADWEFTVVRAEDGGFDVTTGDETTHCTEFTILDHTAANGEYYAGWVDPTR
jgi:hypothetical protein